MSTDPEQFDQRQPGSAEAAGGGQADYAATASNRALSDEPETGAAAAETGAADESEGVASRRVPPAGDTAEGATGQGDAEISAQPEDSSLAEPEESDFDPPDEVGDEEEDDVEEADDADMQDVEPLELVQQDVADEDITTEWYILKVQVNREESIRDALQRRVKIEGLDRYFKEIVVPTEDVAEFTKTGKRRVVKRKLYPGYIMVNMHINDDTWFLVRETPGIGDFTGSAGKPTPMNLRDVERILNLGKAAEEGDTHVKTAIPFKQGDRVRVKDGYFQNFEGDVESVDEANGRVTVMINIFGRSTPVELEHWQIEAV